MGRGRRAGSVLCVAILLGVALAGCVGDEPLGPGSPAPVDAQEEPILVLSAEGMGEGLVVTWNAFLGDAALHQVEILASDQPFGEDSADPVESWSFTDPLFSETLDLPLPPGEWYVRARALDDSGHWVWSEQQRVVVPGPTGTSGPGANGDSGFQVNAGSDLRVSDGGGKGEVSFNLNGRVSPGPGDTVLRYAWFEDDVRVSGTFLTTVTRPIGSYEFTFRVVYQDANGVEGLAEDSVRVDVIPNRPPQANPGPPVSVRDTDGSGTAPVPLDGSRSTDPDGRITSYTWHQGDVQILTGRQGTVELPVGTHTITLTVRDNAGATDSASLRVTVHPPFVPIAQAKAQDGIDLDGDGTTTVTLDGSGSFHPDPSNTITQYTWNDAAGQVVATEAVAELTVAVGTHTFTLTVEDDVGMTGSDSVTVTIEPQPDPPMATFTRTCNARTCTFDASESTGYQAVFNWEFSDGAQATGPVVTHTFPDRARYTITLTVEDAIGRIDTTDMEINLRPDLPLTISSNAFGPGDEIPGRYGCQLAFNAYPAIFLGIDLPVQLGISPPLTLTAPQDAESLVVTILDRVEFDGSPQRFPHWLIYDIPIPSNGIVEIPEMGPPNGTEGTNHFNELGFLEFCGVPVFTPSPHPFEFSVFALDTTLNLEEGATLQELTAAMDGHVLGSSSFTAVYSDKICREPIACVFLVG